jgi:hypothetical protein
MLAFSFLIIITGVGAQTGLDGCVLPLAGTPIDVWLKRISATAGTIG